MFIYSFKVDNAKENISTQTETVVFETTMVRNGDFVDKTRNENLYKPINCCYYQFLPTFGTFLFRNVQFKTEGKKLLGFNPD